MFVSSSTSERSITMNLPRYELILLGFFLGEYYTNTSMYQDSGLRIDREYPHFGCTVCSSFENRPPKVPSPVCDVKHLSPSGFVPTETHVQQTESAYTRVAAAIQGKYHRDLGNLY